MPDEYQKIVHITVDDNTYQTRLDKAIASLFTDISRTRVKHLLVQNCIYVDGILASDGDTKVHTGQEIEVRIPYAETLSLEPKDIELDIVFEDEHILVINKQAGLTVHPGAGTHNDTLVHALLAHCKGQLSSLGGTERPGIVHRLDRNTTGLMVVAKSDVAHKKLAEQIEARSVERKYIGICWGKFSPLTGLIDANIARSTRDRKKMAAVQNRGKQALTHYKTRKLLAGGKLSLVEFKLETGRTHQIRVHASHNGHSLLGDPEYGHNQRKINKEWKDHQDIYEQLKAFKRQALHAYSLCFMHPILNTPQHFEIPLANDMQHIVHATE